MRLLLDQDVFLTTANFLKEKGHDVLLAAQLDLSQASDEQLLKTAQELKRIFVTRDRDYGSLVFVKALGAGVLYLRMLPSNQNEVHKELGSVLTLYSESELTDSFVVIEADGHRFRKIPRPK